MNSHTRGRLIQVALVAFLVASAGCSNEGRGGPPEPERQARPAGPLAAKEVLTLRSEGLMPQVQSLTFSPDGKRLAAGVSEQLRVWDATGNTVLTLKTGRVYSVAYRPDGKQIAVGTGGYKSGRVLLFDAVTGKEQGSFEQPGEVLGVAFSPDGKRVASAGKDRLVRVREVDTGKEVALLQGSAFGRKNNSAWVDSVAYSRDGKWLASGTGSGTVDIWEAETGKLARTVQVYNQAILALAFSPDSKRLATGTGFFLTGEVKVCDVVDGKEVLKLDGHTGYVTCVAFSPDGKRLASSAVDDTVRVWDLQVGKEALALKVHADDGDQLHKFIQTVAFSPDGKRLASGGGDGIVRVWELRD
jgi:WD40 repeat protein